MSLLTFIKVLSLHFLIGGPTAPSAEDRYIQNYKDIAIAEMHRSGIPASIKLAQGLLESQAGNSSLATKANNHFGIKCKKGWVGPTYYKKDDDRDRKGKLMESCFRAYDYDHQSYIDHTNFLLHRKRYKDLFSYGRQDYVNWAIGLKRCGYATDKKYAQKLINTIESYNLSQYDRVEAPTFSKSVKVTMPVYQIPTNYRPGDGPKKSSTPVKKVTPVKKKDRTKNYNTSSKVSEPKKTEKRWSNKAKKSISSVIPTKAVQQQPKKTVKDSKNVAQSGW